MRLTLDCYILREWLKILLLSLFVTLGLLLVHDVYDNLPDLLSYHASLSQIISYYIGLFPSFLPAVIPLSFMLSLLFSLGSLHRNGEIIAMRAAGLSLFQMTRSLWLVGVFLSAVLFYLNAFWVPWSIEHSKSFEQRLRLAHELESLGQEHAGKISPFTYANTAAHQLWVMHAFSEITNEGFGINFYAYSEEGHPLRQIVAKEGFFDEVEGFWVFLEGREIIFDSKGEPIRSLYFDRLLTPEYRDNPEQMRLLSEKPADLSLWELRQLLSIQSSQNQDSMRPYALRYQSILASPLMALIVLFLSIPLAVGGVRANPLVGVSKCLGLFFIYFFFESLCTLLGEQGHLPLLLAVWLPGVSMLGVAFYLYRKEA